MNIEDMSLNKILIIDYNKSKPKIYSAKNGVIKNHIFQLVEKK